MKINGKTKLYGILGWPLSHTLSPLVHNLAFEYYKINAVYVPLAIKDFHQDYKSILTSMQFQGLSVTIPYKLNAKNLADECDTLTENCGAANTLVYKKEKWMAYNTDGYGALQALQELRELNEASILVLGNGGAALGLVYSLLDTFKNVTVTITGRNMNHVSMFVNNLIKKNPESFSKRLYSLEQNMIQPENIDVIVNCTPLGLMEIQKNTKHALPQALPIEASFLRKHHCVFDMVYSPRITPLLAEAKKIGAEVGFGYKMFLYQACKQIELFCEQTISKALFRKIEATILKSR